MKLRICRYGEKILREKSVPVAAVDGEMRKLADAMLALMHELKGVGLAAEQVGRTERMCVIDIPDGCENEEDAAFNAPIAMPLKMWNPQIIVRNGSVLDKEGCLSFPDIGGSVVRAEEVVCTYIDEENLPQTVTARGFLARAIQHETDHLDGTLYIDRMSAVERLKHASKLKKLARRNGG